MTAFLILLFFLLFPQQVSAIYNPLSVPNNRYGIHVVDANDISGLPSLVNSTGGGWGYVTMVLSDSEQDHDRWQNIFNQMRRLHIIPIIRLATHVEGTGWVKPTKDRFYEIVKLLNSLNWPTENRYVILYNEPNHAKEWGGQINPEEYADYLVTFATALKQAHEDFFILPAGLDASAATDGEAMDESEYLRRMIAAKPEILSLVDGWTSHSYANPGFSGSPYARGRGTLTSYLWELSFLSSLGLTRNLPVFITETGWQHSGGKSYIPSLLSPDQVGVNLQIAAQNVWNDPNIVAVTPFLYNYQDVPFDHFSFTQLGGGEYYSHYFAYQAIEKIKGTPKQRESYTFLTDLIPHTLVAGSVYTLETTMTNDGQGIVDPKDGYELVITGSDMDVFIDSLPVVEPTGKGTISVHLKTQHYAGTVPVSVTLRHNNNDILLQKRDLVLVPPPSVEIHANLGWRKTGNASDATILIYDNHTLLQKFTGLIMENGFVSVSGLTNIIPGKQYRVVTLVPGYLPRQTISVLTSTTTILYPKRFLPLDFNNDGTFTTADFLPLLRMSPITAILRFFGP